MLETEGESCLTDVPIIFSLKNIIDGCNKRLPPFCIQVVYIAPLKAIVRERMNDWRKNLVQKLGKHMVNVKDFVLFCSYI